MTDEELVKTHDMLLAGSHTLIGLNYYQHELERRAQDRLTKCILQQTGTVVRLT